MLGGSKVLLKGLGKIIIVMIVKKMIVLVKSKLVVVKKKIDIKFKDDDGDDGWGGW